MPGRLSGGLHGWWRQARLAFVLALSVLTAACTTTGNQFDDSALRLLVPGQTTLEEASAYFKADPVNVYRNTDGSAIARWAHTASFVPDAVYFNREIWLAFDRYGRYQRIVKSNNIPRAYEFGDKPQAPLPPTPASTPSSTPTTFIINS